MPFDSFTLLVYDRDDVLTLSWIHGDMMIFFRASNKLTIEVPVDLRVGIVMCQFKHRTAGITIQLTGNKNNSVLFRIYHIHTAKRGSWLAILSKRWKGFIRNIFGLEVKLLHRRKYKPVDVFHVVDRCA